MPQLEMAEVPEHLAKKAREANSAIVDVINAAAMGPTFDRGAARAGVKEALSGLLEATLGRPCADVSEHVSFDVVDDGDGVRFKGKGLTEEGYHAMAALSCCWFEEEAKGVQA